MTLLLLTRWAMVTLGVIYFVTESAIFSWPRVRIARVNVWTMLFVYCAPCVGFWVGVASAQWLWPFDGYDGLVWAQLLEGGAATMALGAIWKRLNDGNPTFNVEAELLNDDAKPEEEESTNA